MDSAAAKSKTKQLQAQLVPFSSCIFLLGRDLPDLLRALLCCLAWKILITVVHAG